MKLKTFFKKENKTARPDVESYSPTKTEEEDKPQSHGDENKQRGNWSNQIEFTLSGIGYAVGIGNLWRFPYLCMRNGGGAFLIPYFFFLFVCGLPLFYLELIIGQFSSLSPLSVWKMSPLFKGIGWGMIVVSAVVTIYYNIFISWSLYFLGKSFAKVVPWATCDNWWNTEDCYDRTLNNNETLLDAIRSVNESWYNFTSQHGAAAILTQELIKQRKTPAEEFWQFNVLELSEGIHEIGGIRWQMLLCLIAAWFLIFFSICKGVKSLGKVVYVTATAPYVFLTILLIRGCLLPGAVDGILFYIKPDFSRLLEFKVWGEACLQIFYSLGPAWGGLITMASYNKFNNNCFRDSLIVCCFCSGSSFYAGYVIFSVIGYMAYETGLPVDEVITSGPGLAFIVYPEVVTKLPLSPLWAVLFFINLITIGIDGQFGTLETVASGFVDEFPRYLSKHKTKWTGFVCFVEFLLSLILATRAGMYFFQILDWYAAAFSVVVIALFELFVCSYIYGVNRVYSDMEMMFGKKPCIIWKLLWGFITPGILLTILIFSSFRLGRPTYGAYEYPDWAVGLGWVIAMCSIVPIPGYMVYAFIRQSGSPLERMKKLIRPAEDWGPSVPKFKALYHRKRSLQHCEKSDDCEDDNHVTPIYKKDFSQSSV